MFYYDPSYIIVGILTLIIMGAAQMYVRSAYNKWSKVPTRSGVTGEEAVRRLMRYGGLYNIQIEGVRGNLTDHYDPRNRTLRLSESVYRGNSVAALAIAAHELGHAMQDKEEYFPLRFRSLLVPAVNIGSWLGWILVFAGLLLNFTNLAWLGVIIFAGGAVFALATLPVEFNASARARVLLKNAGLITTAEEERGVNKVLNAAAMTYIAALIVALLQLLRIVLLVMGRRR